MPSESLTPQTPLIEARDWLRDRIDEGVPCPCCEQMAKVYRRKMSGGAVRALVLMSRRHGSDWFHGPSQGYVAALGGDWARLAMWRLIEEEPARHDGGGRAGWWSVTGLGHGFIHQGWTVPKYVRIYNGRALGFSTKRVSIEEALGQKFRLDDLMAGI